ncbi:hypothetical protein ACOSP7_011251 [Xanthoceras sorbifolium]
MDPRSGFCKSNSVFYSKRKPTPHPPNQYLDVTTFISSKPHHGKVAFIDAATGRHVTFCELWRAVDSVATCLSDDMGIRKGHVVVILSPNSVLFPIVCFAVMSLGAVITTMNPVNTPREIAMQIADSKPVLVFTVNKLVPKLASLKLPIVLLDDTEPEITIPIEAKILTTLQEMIKRESNGRRVKDRVEQDDTATLLYSSGTTGTSKGVKSSHRNYIAMIETFAARFKTEDTFICTVPMFHIYGLGAFVMALHALGSTIVILSRFDMHVLLSSVSKYKATCLPIVPPVVVAMVNDADQIKTKYDLSSLRSILCGGAPLSKEVIEGFLRLYPTVDILQGYALTESTGTGASTNTAEESRRYGTVGILTPNSAAKIVDPVTGEALSVNRTGELWLRGPSIMKGYFSNLEATTSTLDSERWLRTGDLCYIDEDGFLFIVDRLKELIKYKGFQVAPAELEALLLTHPEISDAAVIPFPDKEVGQYPMAYVVRKTGSDDLSETAVMCFVAKQVAPYKRIRRVAFVASIPKTPSGKILRKDLIKLATSKL